VRHAPVAVRGLCYGRGDVELAMGADEACGRVLAQLAAGGACSGQGAPSEPIARIVSSPSRRTRGLAEALGAALALPVEIDEWLAELSFGAWELRTWDAIEEEDGARLHAWMSRWRLEAPPGGERVDQLVARVAAFRASVGDARVLAVTHAGVIRALRALERGVDFAEIINEPVEHLVVERSAVDDREGDPT
jgi:alpha-ribazole phosphatase